MLQLSFNLNLIVSLMNYDNTYGMAMRMCMAFVCVVVMLSFLRRYSITSYVRQRFYELEHLYKDVGSIISIIKHDNPPSVWEPLESKIESVHFQLIKEEYDMCMAHASMWSISTLRNQARLLHNRLDTAIAELQMLVNIREQIADDQQSTEELCEQLLELYTKVHSQVYSSLHVSSATRRCFSEISLEFEELNNTVHSTGSGTVD